MRIAITGASGNVGTALLRRLARDAGPSGHEVVGICRRLPAAGEPPYAGVDWRSVDIAGPGARATLTEAFTGVDAVVHAAWLVQPQRNPPELARVNLLGSRNVFAAAVAAGVPHLVHMSSIGTYAPHPADDSRVDESWPATGIPPSQYSREKAVCEAELDTLEQEHPQLRVARIRPGLVFQHDSGSEIARYFAGALLPARLLRRVPLPVLPLPRGVRVQVIHADDLADALARVLERGASGAFNLADEPVLGGRDLGAALKASRLVAVNRAVARAFVAASFHARVHTVQPGWYDLAMGVPVMDTSRARNELGWQPVHAARDVLVELLEGMRGHAGTVSPVLRSRSEGVTARTGT